jgi:polar amino acid transport system permease protein
MGYCAVMFDRALEYLPLLLQGVKLTLVVAVGSLALSTVLGLSFALAMHAGNTFIRRLVRGVVTVIRGIPMVVQLFYVYFVLPDLGIELNAVQAAIIGLGIGYSAYQAENFRAGLEAVDRGQMEAAKSMGMSVGLALRRVIVPQAVKIAMPPFGNIVVMMLKDSSLASTITVGELTRQGQLIASSTFQNTEIFTMVAIMYLMMSLPLMALSHWVEVRLRGGKR